MFKVGDYVQYSGGHPTTLSPELLGDTGVVTSYNKHTVYVKWTKVGEVRGVYKENIRPAKAHIINEFYA